MKNFEFNIINEIIVTKTIRIVADNEEDARAKIREGKIDDVIDINRDEHDICDCVLINEWEVNEYD